MQIAGINSADYRNKNNGQNRVNRDNSTENQSRSIAKIPGKSQAASNADFDSAHKVVSRNYQKPSAGTSSTQNENSASHSTDYKLLTSANPDSRNVSGEKIGFYSQIAPEFVELGAKRNYHSGGAQSNTPIPDNTSHKARQAIAEYLNTQYVEERHKFKEALGVDEYA